MPGAMVSMIPQQPSAASLSRTGVRAAASGVSPFRSGQGRSAMPSRTRKRILFAVIRREWLAGPGNMVSVNQPFPSGKGWLEKNPKGSSTCRFPSGKGGMEKSRRLVDLPVPVREDEAGECRQVLELRQEKGRALLPNPEGRQAGKRSMIKKTQSP